MVEIMKDDRCDTFIMMFTDVINKGAFILCVGKDEKIFNKAFKIPYGEDNIFLSFCWPLFVIFGVVYAPFWVVRKSAEYVRRSMEKNEEDDDGTL